MYLRIWLWLKRRNCLFLLAKKERSLQPYVTSAIGSLAFIVITDDSHVVQNIYRKENKTSTSIVIGETESKILA